MNNFFNFNRFIFGTAIILGTIIVIAGFSLGILNLLTGGF